MGPPASRGTKRKDPVEATLDDGSAPSDSPFRGQRKYRKVVLYREYREGELPDIEVSIAPRLAQRLG